MSAVLEEIVADYRNIVKDYELRIKQLEEKLSEYENKFGTYSKEQCCLLKKIQEVKEILLNSDIKKTGYNNHNNYSYFELQDITSVIIPALIEKNLSSKFYMNDERIFLQIIDNETGAWDQVSTKLKVYQREDVPRGDLTYLMKYEQAAQTYARRTLWLLMLDIVEPVPEEAEPTKNNNTKNPKNSLKLPEEMDEVTSSIFDKIKKDFGNKVAFNTTTVKNKLGSMKKSKEIDEEMYKKCIEIVQ